MTLPQLSGGLFVTDGGLETDLIFNRGVELPEFAAFVLLDDPGGMRALFDYYEGFLAIAREHGAGFILDTPTWRANRDWGQLVGYDRTRLADVNKRWVEVIAELRERLAGDGLPIVLDGTIGPRGDGYVPGAQMTADEAAGYHSEQIASFADSGVDMVTALTMNYAEEAVGIARAAAAQGLPAVISFTVETDGRLPTGQRLGEAIDQVDSETGGSAAYFMVNCAHPTHFEHVLARGDWRERVRGIRANASKMSHAELDEAEELDAGDPDDLAAGYARLREHLPNLCVLGGCCGTDRRHVAAVTARLAGA
ncbi:MAG TPA: homocysteine S-methyltransferase family protein [Thermoleophilaceae bacterium]|jgi:homocysteine S-methyltransferase|nr:homocysteine S-methyltransferase family protein [Thermoleophilaceae bacterium]